MKVSAISLLGLLSAAVQAHDLLSITINAKDAAPLYDVIKRNSDVDYGCRPTVLKSRSVDEHKVHAFVSRSQLKKLRRSLDPNVVRIDMMPDIKARQSNLAPIGKGNRFSKGGFPRGLGTRKPGETLGPILNVEEVTSAMKALEKEYGMDTFVPPFKTFEGRSLIGGIANKAEKAKRDKQYIYFTSGIHARERGGPDNLIYFVSDLLYANEHRIGVTYGNKTFSNKDVKAVLGAGIVFIPLTNPDGVTHDQANSNLWRKNRNPTSSVPGNDRSVGVDLNRNFDFGWNYTKYFNPELEPASNDSSSEVFYGTSPFSEPETRSIKWGMDQFPNIRWYIDVHSAAGTLLYSWGDDENQSTDPKQNFRNPAYDGKRGVVGDEVYKEYIPQKDWNNIARVSNVTTAAMNAVGGREYVPQQSVGLYPTSGASDDYAFSRHFANPKLNKIYGYTMEFGYPTNFYPTDAEYLQNILDTNAGFMTFILEAIKVGLKN